MVVQHNLQAMNANRMLNVTTGNQSKSTEKLSSGYKINRAADDAAGLSISEKMRKQIRGLDQASSNAQDGVSAVQTAEGALTEVHSMLQRMNELAVQAANGTNSESDRQSIQDEIEQLTSEIDRVAETTKFNEIYLLKGDVDGRTVSKELAAHDAGFLGKLTDNGDGTSTFKLDKALKDGDKVNIAGKNFTIGSKEASTDGFEKLDNLKTKVVSVGDSVSYVDSNGDTQTKTLVDKAANANGIYTTNAVIEIDGKKYTIVAAKTDLSTGELTAADATHMVGEALANGKKATLTKTGNTAAGIYEASKDVKVEIVGALDADKEVSALTINNATAGAPKANELATAVKGGALAAGDVVTLKGEQITATDEAPVNMATVKDVVKELKANDVIKIGTTSFTIADKTNVGAGKYTVEDVLALLNDKDTVEFTTVGSAEGKVALTVAGLVSGAGNKYTAVETKLVSAEDNVISVKDAYKMMAEELAKASSIGTDKGSEATVKSDNSGSFTIKHGSVVANARLNFNLHVGSDAAMSNKIGVDIETMSAANLGIKGINVKDTSGMAATYAIDAIADAISKVSEQRSALGAIQNRLEHSIANLDNVVENTTSAESRIRDTDMAEEMVEYSKNNILAQAGQSMLAQANQSTQGVMSLLQ